ncbi:MAG: hypothetical protein V2I62_07695, partial [Bacteroidales bacterium]|nr:hypothetical protein [Bacteroidales bacterium]
RLRLANYVFFRLIRGNCPTTNQPYETLLCEADEGGRGKLKQLISPEVKITNSNDPTILQ